MFSQSEENYLKAIYRLEVDLKEAISTNLIAEKMDTKASSVTDMMKRLAVKDLVDYEKYKGVLLTGKGKKVALSIIRKHRLWESFLVEKLHFKWDEVHEIAEQLEHINSEELINRIDEFLDFPEIDPHGDPIPDRHGNIVTMDKKTLSNCPLKIKCIVVGVKDSSKTFLKFLAKFKISLGSEITILNKEEYDNSLTLNLDNSEVTISHQIAKNLFIKIAN